MRNHRLLSLALCLALCGALLAGCSIVPAPVEAPAEAAAEETSVASSETVQQGNADDGTINASQIQAGEQGASSRIQSTPKQDQATESLAISFGLALLAYYGLVTLSEKNRRMHG